MLADAVLEDPTLRRNLMSGYDHLVRDLKSAARFELSPTFAEVSDQLARDNVKSFSKILPLTNLPYQNCWFEVAFADRPSFVNGTTSEYFHSEPVSRVGLLIRTDPENPLRWVASLCWSFKSGACNISAISIVMDRSDDAIKRKNVPLPEDYEEMKLSDQETAAMIDIESRTLHMPCPYYLEIMSMMKDQLPRDEIIKMAVQDWKGEIMYWMGVVALINGRNVSVVEPGPDRSKLSKARVKKGKLPLMDFSVCKIAPRIAAAYRGGSGSGSGVRTHFVRGHFKARKTGIFWWTDHMRGHLSSDPHHRSYQVV